MDRAAGRPSRQGSTKEAYAEAIKSRRLSYAPRDVARQPLAQYGRALNRRIPDLAPADRKFLMDAKRAHISGKPEFATEFEKKQWKRIWANHGDGMRAVFGYPPAAKQRPSFFTTVA
jgi:hypothetical protein